MPALPFEVTYPDAPLGAIITGIDIGGDLDAATFGAIERVFLERGVVCFRGQQLTPAQHVAFSSRFGEVETPLNRQYALASEPQVLVISNVQHDGRNIGISDAGQLWHTDSSYMEIPTRCSLLYALEVPHDDAGEPLGDTLFASMTAAYDALPADTRAKIDELKAVHNFTLQYERRRAKAQAQGDVRENVGNLPKPVPDMVHPVARTHPLTGRKCVYVNGAFAISIPGMDDAESSSLLDYLFRFSTDDRFVYRHRWQVGDLLMWDNCSTQHNAIPDYRLPQRRLMYRTTVKGTERPR
jgi:taurine dioxygenase